MPDGCASRRGSSDLRARATTRYSSGGNGTQRACQVAWPILARFGGVTIRDELTAPESEPPIAFTFAVVVDEVRSSLRARARVTSTSHT